MVVANATGCMEIISTAYPQTAWEVPYIHVAFENAAAVGSGVEAGLKALRRKGQIADRDVKTIAIGGDGGTADIGLQALSGAMERGHDMIFFCLDNEAYMNTGIQRSERHPVHGGHDDLAGRQGHPGPADVEEERPRDHGGPQGALRGDGLPELPASTSSNKVKKAKAVKGPAYIHVFSMCPTGWRCASEITIKLGRLAVETGVFPLYEVENGKYRLTMEMPEKLRPVRDYLKPQGRFRHLGPSDIETIQERVNREWEILLNKVECMQPW
ncbi:MAG: thiamine pyrophosphate-dependent enzyme [Comamonadaceae bacterium]|nr:thiamine pyrophosphate-dependent enzyme [Comamonadaceae bacterium]